MKKTKKYTIGTTIFLLGTLALYFVSPFIFSYGTENNFFAQCIYSTTVDGGYSNCRPTLLGAAVISFLFSVIFIFLARQKK